jgi:hypothetical protein
MYKYQDLHIFLLKKLNIKEYPIYIDRYDENYELIKRNINSNDISMIRKKIKEAGYCSQNGEDIIIEFILEKLNIYKGHVVEFGARDGINGSNTFRFVKKQFRSLMIEGDNDSYQKLKRNMKKYPNVIPCKKFINLSDNKIDDILDSYNFSNVDVMSIDIDSNDYWIWNSMKTHKPKIIVVEFNPNFTESKTIAYKEDFMWKYDCYYGATAKAMYKLGLLKGYDLIYNFQYNLIFIDSEINKNMFEILDFNKTYCYWRKDKPSDQTDWVDI